MSQRQRKCLIGLENDEPAADKQEGFDAVEEPVIETLFIQEEKNCKVQIQDFSIVEN